MVTFQFGAPNAQSVAVAGEFNGWDPRSKPLKRDSKGVWKATLRLQPGSYQYKFVVDGTSWEEDPACPDRVTNDYGGFNSMREVV